MTAAGSQIIQFADPYKQCGQCKAWVDGFNETNNHLVPCGHHADYIDLCPSWSPVTGCGCAEYSAQHPGSPVSHAMRPPADDGKVYGPLPVSG